MAYLATRFSTLLPERNRNNAQLNFVRVLRSIKYEQWVLFLIGFFSWSLDALDFHAVTQTYNELAIEFGVTPEDISWAVTLTLMLRFVGGAIFGTAADILGRKWPFVCNFVLIIILEIATGCCQTYRQFLAVRALFGIAMGGVYGNAAATALEDCPEEARGILSGLYQSGYNFGFLLAVAFWKLFYNTRHGWRALFWFTAGLPVVLIIVRICLPETKAFQDRPNNDANGSGLHRIITEAKVVTQKHWLLLIYLVLLMTGFGYMSHGSQDLYSLMLQYKYNYNNHDVTTIQVVAILGAILGGTIMGHLSQFFGRRLCIILLCFFGAVLIYPYTSVSGRGIYVVAFLEQFCVQGAFGIIPIHLLELSPIAFRTFFVGTSYQLGVLISCASNTIETHIGERYPLPPRTEDGHQVRIYDYGPVICIFMACVFAYNIIVTVLGPERRNNQSRLVVPEGQELGDWDVPK